MEIRPDIVCEIAGTALMKNGIFVLNSGSVVYSHGAFGMFRVSCLAAICEDI